MGLGWAQILLVRHLWVLKTPQDQSGLGSAQNDGVASALALQSPFQMVQFVPVHLQHTNKEAGDYKTTFHRVNHQGPQAMASVTSLCNLLAHIPLTTLEKQKPSVKRGRKVTPPAQTPVASLLWIS